VSSFGHWKRKLAGQTPKVDAATADFVELTADVADPPFAHRDDWDIELELGAGLVLRLRRR
jgi:hypothetical protein